MDSDWLKHVTWLVKANHNTLFLSRVPTLHKRIRYFMGDCLQALGTVYLKKVSDMGNGIWPSVVVVIVIAPMAWRASVIFWSENDPHEMKCKTPISQILSAKNSFLPLCSGADTVCITFLPTYPPTYIPTYLLTYIPLYLPTYYRHTCPHIYRGMSTTYLTVKGERDGLNVPTYAPYLMTVE